MAQCKVVNSAQTALRFSRYLSISQCVVAMAKARRHCYLDESQSLIN